MRLRLPRFRRRGGTMPAYPGSGDSVLARIEPPPRDVVARLHGGPCDGHAVVMTDWPGPGDTIRIEDDEDPTQPDAVYVPRDVQPDGQGVRDFDHAPEKT